MKVNQKEIESVLRLPASKKYSHFVKRVADWEVAWGLYDDGWALAETDSGEKVFPLWPAEDYAKLCMDGDWRDYQPSSIPLRDLFDELLPALHKDKVLVGVFYTSFDKGVTVEASRLSEDLKQECNQYE